MNRLLKNHKILELLENFLYYVLDLKLLNEEYSMNRFDTLREKILPMLLPYGIRRVAVFGSYARGEETPESDIDILVDFEEPRRQPLGLLAWVRLERELSERVGRRVDLVSTGGLSRNLRPYVEAEMETLYEKTG
jgi:predicted nucleotidyltransferase